MAPQGSLFLILFSSPNINLSLHLSFIHFLSPPHSSFLCLLFFPPSILLYFPFLSYQMSLLWLLLSLHLPFHSCPSSLISFCLLPLSFPSFFPLHESLQLYVILLPLFFPHSLLSYLSLLFYFCPSYPSSPSTPNNPCLLPLFLSSLPISLLPSFSSSFSSSLSSFHFHSPHPSFSFEPLPSRARPIYRLADINSWYWPIEVSVSIGISVQDAGEWWKWWR